MTFSLPGTSTNINQHYWAVEMTIWTIAEMRTVVTDGVHTQDQKLRERLRNGRTFEEIEAVQFDLKRTYAWSDSYGGLEEYHGYLLLEGDRIPVRCKRIYSMNMGSKWTFEQVRGKVVKQALEVK